MLRRIRSDRRGEFVSESAMETRGETPRGLRGSGEYMHEVAFYALVSHTSTQLRTANLRIRLLRDELRNLRNELTAIAAREQRDIDLFLEVDREEEKMEEMTEETSND